MDIGPDTAEVRGLSWPEARRITVISFKVGAKSDWRLSRVSYRPVELKTDWTFPRMRDAKRIRRLILSPEGGNWIGST
jgi:hypothetical protein